MDVKKKRGGQKPIDHAKQADFLKAFYDKRGLIGQACKLAGCSRQTVLNWREKDPTFAERYDEAREDIKERLLNVVYDMGEVSKDLTALIFSLKALDRAMFDDAFARTKWLTERGLQDPDVPVPQRAVLVRGNEPEAVVRSRQALPPPTVPPAPESPPEPDKIN